MILLYSFEGTTFRYSDNNDGDTPISMPNIEVKPIGAESTWLEAAWKDRTLLNKEAHHERWWAFLVSYPSRPLSVNIELNCFANSCVAKYFLIAVKKVWRHGYRCVENAYGQALEQTGLPFKRKSMRISIQLNGSQQRQDVVVAPMPTRKLSTHAEILGAEKSIVSAGCKSL